MGLPLPLIPPWLMLVGGATLLLLVTFQMLLGYRKIHLKGPLHLKVHKIVAWTLLVAALGHATAGLIFLGYIR